MSIRIVWALVAAIACAACSNVRQQTSAVVTARPSNALASASSAQGGTADSPTAVPTNAQPRSGPASAGAEGSASPAPSDANLLSFARGTFVRSWTSGASPSGPEMLPQGSGYQVNPAFSGTPELVFELPGIATVSRIAVSATVPTGTTARLHFAAATSDRQTFTDAGTIALTSENETSATLAGPISARWLRVRIERAPGGALSVQSIAASGTVTMPAASFAGVWTPSEALYGSDAIFDNVKGVIPDGNAQTGASQLATLVHAGSLIAATCTYARDVVRGPIVDGIAQVGSGGTLAVVGSGSLLVGVTPTGERILARRVASAPACRPAPVGRGATIAIVARYPNRVAEYGTPTIVKNFRYETSLLPLLTANDLVRARVAVLAMSCSAGKDSDAWQQRALLDFVAAGHVLIVRDADLCAQSDYSFLPYPFTTVASGARGAMGSVLYIVDSSVLGSSDRTDAQHYVDTAAYLKNTLQQLGDADIMQTSDVHWCGLLFAKNAAGASGWIRAYARHGKGLIVYDGFDADDLHGAIPQAVTLTRLAYDVSPAAELPCSAHVAAPLVVLSSARRSIAFGKPHDETFAFSVVRQGAGTNEPVTMTLAGETGPGWRARLDRHSFTLGSSAQAVHVTVHVPANATPTRHMYALAAAATGGQSAQAAIIFDVSEPLAKELEHGGRARIYGIHFDVASARIQPQSESVIREIAAVLRGHPQWRMKVEGYTDSDGGTDYNLALSRRRAQAVVNELIVRYAIARGRLQSEGFGLTHPVASNASDAGKALNRRVELVRLP